MRTASRIAPLLLSIIILITPVLAITLTGPSTPHSQLPIPTTWEPLPASLSLNPFSSLEGVLAHSPHPYVPTAPSIQQLTNNSYHDINPQIHNGQIAWQCEVPYFSVELFFWDGSSITQLTSDGGDDVDPQVDNGQIAWELQYSQSHTEICFWNGSSITQLTNNGDNDLDPQLHNGQIVWYYDFGGEEDEELFFWNGSSIIQLTNNGYTDDDPQLHNGQIAWQGNQEIWFWNGSSITQLTNNGDNSNPQLHNGQIAWQHMDGSDVEIFFWNGSTTIQLTDNAYDDLYPQLHNGWVTWQGWDGSDWEIFRANGEIFIQLTDNAYNDYSPQIHDGQVTWYGWDGGDYEIFVDLDNVPPEIDQPLDVSYEYSTSPHTLTWLPSDSNPAFYRVTQNGALFQEGSWGGGNITIDIGGLKVGYYLFTCEVWDNRGYRTVDTVSVVVYETTIPPTWVIGPTDQTLDYNEGFDCQLVVADASGIDHWTLNDTTNFVLSATSFMDWGSTTHITNDSTLAVGIYGLNVTAYDVYGLKVSGVLTVTVLAPPLGPVDLSLPLLVLLGGVTGVAIGAVVLLLRQREKS